MRRLSLLWALCCATLAATAATPQPTNVIVLFVDDMGYADIGPFGNKTLRTPHLDRFAKEGMRFTSFYATPVCSMSRASLLTGCYNARISMPGVLFPPNRIGLHPDEVTVAEVAKSRGYETMMIGKWHLGHFPEFLPTRQGFDHYFGLPYSNDMKQSRAGFPPLPLYRDEKIVETEPAMKGQTASSSFKPAILSNGARTMVPPHISVGTRIVVQTEDGSYVERAKD
jgi:hypothetical protein